MTEPLFATQPIETLTGRSLDWAVAKALGRKFVWIDSAEEFGEWDPDLIVPRHKLADILGFIECTIIPTFRKFASDRAVATPPMRVGVVKTVYK